MTEAVEPAGFAALSPAVRSVLDERGFEEPTEPQRRAVPALVDGRDALVVAPTGSGKTEAAMLPVFDALASSDREGVGALYVTPLRALNRDVRERLEWWGDRLELDVAVRHGDTTDYQRRRQAEDPPDVLVTTPETLQAALTGQKLRQALSDVDHVVVDEVHELAASKRGTQLAVGLERLRALAGSFQRVGLSATVGDPDRVAAFLTGDRGAAVVDVPTGDRVEFEVVRPGVTDADRDLAGELMTDPDMAARIRAVRDLIAANESVLVFVNTRQTAEALGSRFRDLDVEVGVHHGSLAAEVRLEVEERFKDGEIDALLCTSSMELGIDVGRVDHVVQYGSPREVARLLQRVGRAGHRRGRTSQGTVITRRPDDTLEAMAIARRAVAGEVEPARIHEGSLDVVANQVAGMAFGRQDVDARRAFEVVRRADPFRDLDAEAFRRVVRDLHDNRVVWLDEDADRVETRGHTWEYVYNNLSMIPDEQRYEVYDVTGGTQVGTLDERFVVNFAEPGATFVQRGEMWRVAEVDDDEERVEVTPVEDPGGEVPSWTGSEIPVPHAVAREVGEQRAVAADQLAAGADPEAAAREFAARYPADTETVADAVERVADHLDADAPVPTDDRLVVEGSGRTVVVNAALGHRTNETLGRTVAALLGQRVGSTVGVEVDPYRVELELPAGLGPTDVIDVLQSTDPEHVESVLELSLKRSAALQFRLAHVAETFGARKRYRGDGVSGRRMVEALSDTPAYDEALRELFHEDLDVERAQSVLRAIQAGDLSVVAHGERTPVGSGGRSSGQELLAPENADAGVIDQVRDRLRDDRVRLVCLHCESWDQETKVRRVADQPTCPRCDSTRIAALSPWADDAVAAVRAQEKTDDQVDRTERVYRNASLVQSHGKQAVIALAARGVGPEHAARIINRHREDEADFYRDILEREREYARTKAFWE
ncbi:MAG: DEAD/DEAH box helicase [Halobacteriaceae archaeon]